MTPLFKVIQLKSDRYVVDLTLASGRYIFDIEGGDLSSSELKMRILQRLDVEMKAKGIAAGELLWETPIPTIERVGSMKRANPPALAETLFAFLVPNNSVEYQLGCLQELFESYAKRYGIARARRFYWIQVLKAVGPGVWRALTKWGFIGALVEFGRRKLGW